jgi:hypothetical protein
MKRFSARATHTVTISFLSLGLCLGLMGCNDGIEQACRNQLPAIQKQLTAIQREVASATPGGYGSRAIASVESSSDTPSSHPLSAQEISHLNEVINISLDQKSRWNDWSTSRLVEVERDLDFVKFSSELRPAFAPLTDLAAQLVRFNGYIGQGKAYQAINTIRMMQDDADTVMRQVCGPTETASK